MVMAPITLGTGQVEIEAELIDGTLAPRDLPACLAVGETVISLHPPSPASRCFNMDGEGVSVE